MKFAPDITRRVLFSSAPDKMDTEKAEAVQYIRRRLVLASNFASKLQLISDKTVGTLQMLLVAPVDHPLPNELAQQRKGLARALKKK